METPTITKKQAKNTLSGKKKKTEVIKNTLVQPYQSYWPLLTPTDENHLDWTLQEYFPRLKPPKFNIPYAQIKGVTKSERKNFRKTFLQKNEFKVNEDDKKNIVFGINDVAKLLETQEAGAILIYNEVKPRFLVNHIIDQAVLYNVPIVVTKNLSVICEKKCGIKSVAVAIRKTVPLDSNLGIIQQLIAFIYKNYPIPQNHINISRKLESTVISVLDSDQDDSVLFLSETKEEPYTNYLLKRINGKRAFIPEKSTGKTVFIDLDCTSVEAPSIPKQTKPKNQYHNLKVKRLRSDKNRNKKKWKNIKGRCNKIN